LINRLKRLNRHLIIAATILLVLQLIIACDFNPKQPGDAYVLYNPYEGVNWDTVKQYKANFHTHTIYNKVEKDGTVIWPDGRVLDSDGNEIHESDPDWKYGDNPRSVYRKRDGRLYMDTVIDLYHQADYKILAITDHDHEDYGSSTSWPWTT